MPRKVKAQRGKLVPQRHLCRAVDLVQAVAAISTAELHARALDAQHCFVEIALRRGEFPAQRPGARDIGDISSVFCARVNEDELILLFRKRRIVENVVNHVCAAAAGHDGDVGGPGAVFGGEGVVEVGGEIFFVVPRGAHCGGDGAPCYAPCVAHVCYFGWGFDDAEGIDEGTEGQGVGGGFDGGCVCGICCCWSGGSFYCAEEGGYAGVGGRVGVDGRCGLEHGGEQLLGLFNVAGLVGVEDILGGLDATPRAGPLLGNGVLGPHEKVKHVVA